MKFLLINFIFSLSLFAFNAEVKKSDVRLQINDMVEDYKVGTVINLKAGDKVCFISGDGRVILRGENYKKQLSKRTKLCKQLPLPSNATKDYLTLAQKGVVSLFADAKENEVDGVSRKAVNSCSATTKELVINSDKKFIAVNSHSWGPLPVKLKIYDKDDNLIVESTNDEDINTSFLIPIGIIPTQSCKIEVSNAFGDELMNAKVIVKKNKR